MRPRHATALALIVWYLMLAPAKSSGTPQSMEYDSAAPLTRWNRTGEPYPTAAKCEALRKSKDRNGMIMISSQALFLEPSYIFEVPKSATKCVRSDDPRLKAK